MKEELKEREKYLDKLFKEFITMTFIGFISFVMLYFEAPFVLSAVFMILLGFGVFGMYVTLLQSDEVSSMLIMLMKEQKHEH